ncbi:hypothetical protein IWW50_003931, partial [Coemansia erecta]
MTSKSAASTSSAEVGIQVNGHADFALVDTGAQKVFASAAWCRKAGFKVDNSSRLELTTASARKTATIGIAHI